MKLLSAMLGVLIFAGVMVCPQAMAVSPTDASVPAGGPILIGMANALTGPAQALGTELKEGAQAYISEVNRQGGIHGRKLQLVSYDDAYEPARTISVTTLLIKNDRVFLLFGYVGTPTSRVALPIATRAGVPYVAPFTGAGFLRKPTPHYAVNIRASYADEMETTVEYLTGKLKLKNIAMLIQDDGYGSAGREGVQVALQKRNMEIQAIGKYKRNTKDILPALEKLQANKPEAIIMVGAYAPCAEFIRQARARNFNPVFVNISFVGTRALIADMGKDGEGVYISQVVPSPETSSLPLVQGYRQTIAAISGTLSHGGLEGYLDAQVLARILEKTGPQLTRERFMATVDAMTAEDVGGLTLKFGPEDHQGLDEVYLTRVENGKAVPVDLKP